MTFLFESGLMGPMSEIAEYGPGDVLVLFGELFQRGYANGLVEQAQEKGMTIVRSTVGRRDENHQLRPLNEEELKNFSLPWINIPLECGFDFEPGLHGQTPIDLCKAIGLKEGIQGKLNLDSVKESQQKGRERFRQQVKAWVKTLRPLILPGKKILIAHLMAGGVPRSKIILSLMNRVFKGTGDRYLASKDFWESDLGQLCQLSFQEVTAESFNILIEETAELRAEQEKSHGSLHYSAYGYHGTQIFFDSKLEWFSYTPYLQGFAKKKLEEYAQMHWNKGVKSTVYNCPEILTNSSSIFPGVEIFLYAIIFEIRARSHSIKSSYVSQLLDSAEECLIAGNLPKVRTIIADYLKHPLFRASLDFDQWPSHSNKELMGLMLGVSDELISLHKDPHHLMTTHLSELVIKASGALMLQDMTHPQRAVAWLGHDAIIKFFEEN